MTNTKFSVGQLLLERYRIKKELGEGGQASVYLVDDLKDQNTEWALKMLNLEASTTPALRDEAVQLFQQEVELLRTLQHPGIVAYHDYFEYKPTPTLATPTESRFCLVMEYIPSKLENELINLKTQGFSEAEVLVWALQLAEALSYLHKRNPPIIYRDLKPSNLMLDKSRSVKLIDFGIARRFKLDKRSDTVAMGTPGYAPPEAYSYDEKMGQSDAQSDIFAFGAVLYHLLTGQAPPPSIDPEARRYSRLNSWPPDPSKKKTGISAGTLKLIKTALNFDKNERWPNFEAILTHISSYHNNVTLPPKPADPIIVPAGPVCLHCGQTLRASSRFCSKCGQPINTIIAVRTPSLKLRANGSTWVVQINKTPFLIGRTVVGGVPVDLNLQGIDGSISRQHAEISLNASGYTIVDLESVNGTRVNNHRLASRVICVLRHGDRIALSQHVEIQFLQN
jgi:serine/threonine protein kinase